MTLPGAHQAAGGTAPRLPRRERAAALLALAWICCVGAVGARVAEGDGASPAAVTDSGLRDPGQEAAKNAAVEDLVLPRALHRRTRTLPRWREPLPRANEGTGEGTHASGVLSRRRRANTVRGNPYNSRCDSSCDTACNSDCDSSCNSDCGWTGLGTCDGGCDDSCDGSCDSDCNDGCECKAGDSHATVCLAGYPRRKPRGGVNMALCRYAYVRAAWSSSALPPLPYQAQARKAPLLAS